MSRVRVLFVAQNHKKAAKSDVFGQSYMGIDAKNIYLHANVSIQYDKEYCI